MRAYRAANPDKVAVWEKRNNERNKGAGSDYQKRRYAAKDKARAREDVERWKAENPEKARAIEVARNKRIKAQRRDDPEVREKLNKKSREWQRRKRNSDPDFREKQYAATREWRAENLEWEREYGRKKRDRRKDDPVFKIMASVRRRVIAALKGQSKSASTAALIGAPVEVVKAHIQSQFSVGMTWENWGRGWFGAKEWHLDHVKPLASFDLTDPRQLALACHYTNLQPLWSKDNLIKGASYVVSGDRKS
tara:strand:+ start:1743 stop:2492 length:750 start_codon:yes stop_codon:yes gene_type:complete